MPKIKVGEIYGNFTVLEVKKYSICKDRSRNRIKYKCICGRVGEKREDSFIKYNARCECQRMNEFDKLVGSDILHMTVLERISNDRDNPKYNCICNRCKEFRLITYDGLKNKSFVGCTCPSLNIRSVQNYIYNSYKNAAIKRGKCFDIEFDKFIILCEMPCFYCGKEKSNTSKPHKSKASWSYNGLDRQDSNIGYIDENVVPCCKLCNRMKMTLSYDEFIDHVFSIRDHIESKKCQNTM